MFNEDSVAITTDYSENIPKTEPSPIQIYPLQKTKSTPHLSNSGVGVYFGTEPVSSRDLDPGMGLAVARRTVFRDGDEESFGKVADRVSTGNMGLLTAEFTQADINEQLQLRNAIATGALLTSGRHLQHGDKSQNTRNLEVFTNCSTAIASYIKFYMLLNGSGVGRAYDDALMVVDWKKAPTLLLYLSPDHPDYPHTEAARIQLGIDMQVLPWGTVEDPDGVMTKYISTNFVTDPAAVPSDTIRHRVADSREGWAKAFEILEAMTFKGESSKTLLLDFSRVRKLGSPIGGMQNRPASGPISLMRAFMNMRNHVMLSPRQMPLWEQSLRTDHYFSVEVQVGGARRAARMSTKSWYDPGVLDFARIKSEGGLWTSNHSIMVDRHFWTLVQAPLTEEPLSIKAHTVYNEAIRCSYINGEPGFITGDSLEDHRTGSAWSRPVYTNGEDFQSDRYKTSEASSMLAELAKRAATTTFPVTTNPCGEITLHVMGGVCVIADVAPVLACPITLDSFYPGDISDDLAKQWDDRIEASVRLASRFLIRVNTMNALYGKEIARTNRIGVGPTGLHEWAWMRFGYDFNDLIDEQKSAPFWALVERFSIAAKEEANSYSDYMGLERPLTVTTVKPAGTTSKLFGLTEGAHLPARRQYLRWVQFRGTQDAITGEWDEGSDPRLATYQAEGYPVRTNLTTFPGMTIVGFPTIPLLVRLNIGDRIVTASEATPEQQYQWLRLIEKYWIGETQGNQVSYTMKVYTDNYPLEDYSRIVRYNQPTVRCCAMLPSKPESKLGYEYLPEEEVTADRFDEIVRNIRMSSNSEDVDMVHLQCLSGACPI